MLIGLDYLVWQLWPYLLLSLLLGFGWGWYSCARSREINGWQDRAGSDDREGEGALGWMKRS